MGGALTITIPGTPITKKNSQQLVYAGRPMIIPSKAYKDYRKACLAYIPPETKLGIDSAVNLRCVYYMPTRRRVDLCNLLEATCDILVDAGVLKDDNSQIVAAHDGSRVDLDREQPRVEITIRRLYGEKVDGIQPF